MQSEPYCPRIILGDTPPKAKQREECPHIRAACGEEGAKDRDSFMRTVLTMHVLPKRFPPITYRNIRNAFWMVSTVSSPVLSLKTLKKGSSSGSSAPRSCCSNTETWASETSVP